MSTAAFGQSEGASSVNREMLAQLDEIKMSVNSDETIRVSGKNLALIDRHNLMAFVEDVRNFLGQTTGGDFVGDAYRILLYIEETESDVPAHISKQLWPLATGRTRMPTIRITVSNLADVDPRELAAEICDGLLNMKVVAATENDGSKLHPMPRWFTKGIARFFEVAKRQSDAEETDALWSRARLPPAWALAASVSPYASVNEHVAAQLAAFWLDFPARKERLDRLCHALASGREWSVALFMETSCGETDALEADKAFDVWLLKRRFSVLTVGDTHPALIARIKSRLLIFAGEDDVPENIAPPGRALSPLILAEYADEEWATQTAKRQLEFILKTSAGREEKLRTAAQAYAEFYEAVIRKRPKNELADKYRKAEKLLNDSVKE